MADTATDEQFEALLEYIRTSRGFDFTGYKRGTLTRRFDRRMQTLHIETYEEYLAYLDTHSDEFATLFDTLLINVTSFFRDAPMWKYVADEIVPQIVAMSERTGTLRVWSAGCSTGEEAYTIAMLLAEAMSIDEYRARVKIYATDIDERALSTGRHAVYPEAALKDVPESLRTRHFERVDGSFIVRPDVRRAVIFGRHNLIDDPPISRVDLLSTRNTLMYFQPPAQKAVLANFHFSLRDTGFLFLGKSEVLMTRSTLFTPVDLKRRVFMKVPTAPPRLAPKRIRPSGALDGVAAAVRADIRDAAVEASPVAQLVVDSAGDLLVANLHARMLLGLGIHDVGRPLSDLEVSYRPADLRSAIDTTNETGQAVHIRGVEWRNANGRHVLDVHVHPLGRGAHAAGVSVAFVDTTALRTLQESVEVARQEGETAYEELQATFEELETTNEELQATNEELETTNEELHATNEELETMNEELHSANGELESVNDELNRRTDEMNRAHAFLSSILRGLESAVVVVDHELVVRAWNPAAHELWGLREDEVAGQHFMNLDIGLPVEQLRRPIRDVIASSTHATADVSALTRRGRAVDCTVNVSPLHAPDGSTSGAILMMEARTRE